MTPIRIARTTNTDEGPYIASSLPIRDRFHRWNCKWVKAMELANRIMFRTHDDAVKAGRKPRLTCCA